jgi:hypothetical protein
MTLQSKKRENRLTGAIGLTAPADVLRRASSKGSIFLEIVATGY